MTQLSPITQIAAPEQNPALYYLSGLSEGASRESMRSTLHVIARDMSEGSASALDFPWHELTAPHVQAYRERLAARGMAPATINKSLAAIRGVVKSCWRDARSIDRDTYDRIEEVKPARGSRLKTGRHIPGDQIEAMFKVCAADPNRVLGSRDSAILATLYSCAAPRREELTALRLEDYNRVTQRYVIQHGKNNKQREGWLSPTAVPAMEEWLALRGDAPGPLFAQVQWRGEITLGDPIHVSTINLIVKRITQEAAMKEATTPHDFRRTVIGDLLDAGHELTTVQRLVGHSDPAQTARYCRNRERQMQAASLSLFVPFVGGGN